MPKIAVIKIIKDYDSDSYDYSKIVETRITDWKEVTDDELKLLQRHLKSTNTMVRYVLVQDETSFLDSTIEECLRMAEALKQREQEACKRKAEAKKKREAKKLEEKMKMLKKLKEELGDT